MYGIDISNYTGALSDAEAQLCASTDHEVLVGLQFPGAPYPPGVADQQLGKLRDARASIRAVYFESTEPPVAWSHVLAFRSLIPQAFVAVEDGSGFASEQALDRALAFCDALGLPQRPGIYTSRYMWDRLMPGVTKYADRPLWDACYTGVASVELDEPYGGWHASVIRQYAGAQARWLGQIPKVDLDYEKEAPVAALSRPPTTADAVAMWMAVKLKGTPAAPSGVSVDSLPLDTRNHPGWELRVPR